ncbi:hypothetical protein [Hydrogenimonas sp.]
MDRKDNFLKKILFYVFVPIFISVLAGLVVFYVQRQDLITHKKMESFEYIISQFNALSSKKYDKLEKINFVYNTYLTILDNYKEKSNEYIAMKIDNFKLREIAREKKSYIDTKIIINNIRIHSNLLKIYYGFTIDDTILPIEKMIAVIEINLEMEKTFNTKLYSLMEEVKESFLRNRLKLHIEKISKEFNRKIEQLLKEENTKETLKKIEDLNILYLDEFNIFQNVIYKTYEKEFDFFNFINSKNEFNSIITTHKDNLQFIIFLDKNGKYSLKTGI